MRRAAKRDNGEAEIVEYLRHHNISVEFINERGFPDLMLGVWGILNLPVEIKGPQGSLTPAQKKFKTGWKGTTYVVRSIQDIQRILFSYQFICEYEEGLVLHHVFDQPVPNATFKRVIGVIKDVN